MPTKKGGHYIENQRGLRPDRTAKAVRHYTKNGLVFPVYNENYTGRKNYTFSEEDYETEYARLKSLKSSENYNTYGITGFPYELCAAMTDDYSGIIYALTDKESRKFIYVDIEFCNFFTDIDYKKVIDEKYLPYGFDAEEDNERRKEFEREFEERHASEFLY